MKRNTRKGFTGIELVIVIAIIAILATALIPVFGGLFDSANKTADKQLAKNLNTALLLHNINSEVNDFADVLSAARAEGYLISNLNPTAQGCYLVWESQSNQFLLVDAEEDYKVLFAANTNHPEIGETWHFVTSDLEAVAALKAKGVSVTNVASSVEDLKEALASNVETLYIDESVALDANNLLIIDRDITIELGEASVNSNGVVVNERDIIPIKVTGGHATINGGVIDAAGEALNTQNEPRHYAVRVENGAKATFNGTTFDLAKYNAQIKLGGIVLLKDVVIEATKVGVDTIAGGDVTLDNVTIHADGKDTLYGACVWACDGAHNGSLNAKITIKSGTYSSENSKNYGAIVACGGQVIIDGGNFTTDGVMFAFCGSNGGQITISKDSTATFNGKTAAQLGKSGLQALTQGGTVTPNDDGSFTIK